MLSQKFLLIVLCLSISIFYGCGSENSKPIQTDTYSLEGVITDREGYGVEGVTIKFSGGQGTAETDQYGRWQKDDLSGTITVTPQKNGFAFLPFYRNTSHHSTEINFTAINAETQKIKIDKLGEDYLNIDNAGIGSVFMDSNGSIWVHPGYKKPDTLLEYSLNEGFIKSHKVDDLSAVIYSMGNVYSLVNSGYNNYQIYKMQSSKEPELVNNVEINNNHYINDRILAMNTRYFFNVKYKDEKITIERSGLIDDSNFQSSLDLGEKGHHIESTVVDESNLYILIWLESARYIYIFDMETLNFRERFEVTSNLAWNPTGLVKKGDKLYLHGERAFINLTLDSDGLIESGTKILLLGDYIYFAFPYDGLYVFTGWIDDVPGVYYYNPVDSQIYIVDQVSLEGNYLYNTWSVEASGDKLYITCGSTLKIFENDIYSDSIFIGEFISDLSINKKGTIAVTTNSKSLYKINVNEIEDVIIPEYGYGVDAYIDDSFIIRNRGGDADYIMKYNPDNEDSSVLFELPEIYIQSNDIAVLPDGNLLLNWDKEIKIYSASGDLKGEVDYVFENIANIEYSDYYQQILVLDSFLDGDYLYFIDPLNMEIEKVIDLSQIYEQMTGLAISDDGIIYISTAFNIVYKITEER